MDRAVTLPVGPDILAIIDQRIAAALASHNDTATGVVTSVDQSTLAAEVTFDPTGVAAPVKMLGHVVALEGDRVNLQRFGGNKTRSERPTDERLSDRVGDWYIVGVTNARHTLASRSINQSTGAGQTTNSTWTAMPGSPQIAGFTKVLDTTAVIIAMTWSGFGDNIGTVVEWGVTHDGGVTDSKLGDFQVANTTGAAFSDRQPGLSGFRRFTGWTAGSYDLVFQWRLTTGVYFEQDSGDWISAFAIEV